MLTARKNYSKIGQTFITEGFCSRLLYVSILLMAGGPVWWYTTRVYRASLPLNEIFEFPSPEETQRQAGIPLSLEYDILITIANPEPELLEVDVDGEAIASSIEPFLKNISSIAKFFVKSQWLYLIKLGGFIEKYEDHYKMPVDQLPHAITPLEQKLYCHSSVRPCINLMLYVSPCQTSLNLYNVYGEKSEINAFISRRWGGILVINPDEESCENYRFSPDLKLTAATFVTQLQGLFKIEDLNEKSLWKLQERKAWEMVNSTVRTLKSLAELLSEISYIVISDAIAERIQIAVDNVKLAMKCLENNKLGEGLRFAQIAFNHSEGAFGDASLLARIYFPDDQKFTIYFPMLMPTVFPFLMSVQGMRTRLKEMVELYLA